MCTALNCPAAGCFGRNLDLERSYGEAVTVTPRNMPLAFRAAPPLPRHHAMIGMAHVAQGYPLYYEATNEHGLSIAALNFPESAAYHPYQTGKVNLAPFELIPYLLGRCATLQEARARLEEVSILQADFAPHLPASPLHWLVGDESGSLTVESTNPGLQLYENPAHVLTNEPPFPFHRENLRQYAALTPDPLSGTFSRGAGSFGLPGGLDSVSRFVRAAYTLRCADGGTTEAETVSRFFRILDTVAQTAGCVRLPQGQCQQTLYSCCCTGGVYYYATCENRALTAVSLHREDLEGSEPVTYPLRREPRVTWEN